MKQFFLLSVSCCLLGASSVAQNKPAVKKTPVKAATPAPAPLKNALDSFSYALGLNIANNLKAQSIDKVSYAAMQKAMEDVFKQKALTLSNDQANACIQQTLQKSSASKSNEEKAKSAAFLEANKKRAGVITTASGLQYEILRKGDEKGPVPTAQDTVVAHYAGTLINGKKFDNSYDRGEPLTIPVGGVIRGWTEALQLMHVGDKFKVFIPSELGYGDRGAGADIPGGAALIFEMELLEVKRAAAAMPAKDFPTELQPAKPQQ